MAIDTSNITFIDYLWTKKNDDNTISGIRLSKDNLPTDTVYNSDIPAVNNGALTIQKNGTNVATFTANSSTNQTANIIVPTKTSDIDNDSGYVTGPSSSTANAVPRYDGTTGKIIKNTGVTISDTNVLSATQLSANIIETGTGDNNYFQSRKVRGEGNAATYYHAVDFGFAGHNQVDFYEYGGIWNFWKNTNASATTADSNLCLKIGDTYVKNKNNTFTWPTTSGTLALKDDIPTALKNPNALTFGTKTYDGSSAQSITASDLGALTSHQDISGKVNKSGDTMSGNLNPSTNKGASLGTSSLYWNNIYGTTIYEGGTSLTNKYLGKTAKAADADKLDGNDSTYYLNYNNLTNKPTIPTKVSELTNDSNYIAADNGKIPTSYLPSYVDDVLEYASKSNFPATGETGKIYIAKDTNIIYRWSGTAYIEISASLALGETSSTAYAGDKGKANATNITTLKGYFTNGIANKATSDASGNNIANTYATKSALSTTNTNVSTNASNISTLQGYFNTSGHALAAVSADKATKDAEGNIIHSTYLTKTDASSTYVKQQYSYSDNNFTITSTNLVSSLQYKDTSNNKLSGIYIAKAGAVQFKAPNGLQVYYNDNTTPYDVLTTNNMVAITTSEIDDICK